MSFSFFFIGTRLQFPSLVELLKECDGKMGLCNMWLMLVKAYFENDNLFLNLIK